MPDDKLFELLTPTRRAAVVIIPGNGDDIPPSGRSRLSDPLDGPDEGPDQGETLPFQGSAGSADTAGRAVSGLSAGGLHPLFDRSCGARPCPPPFQEAVRDLRRQRPRSGGYAPPYRDGG